MGRQVGHLLIAVCNLQQQQASSAATFISSRLCTVSPVKHCMQAWAVSIVRLYFFVDGRGGVQAMSRIPLNRSRADGKHAPRPMCLWD